MNIDGAGVAPLKTTSALDIQVGGNHYKGQGVQPWVYIQANGLNFWEGNIIKYVTRHPKKAGLQDLKKAAHYLQFLIENYELLYSEK